MPASTVRDSDEASNDRVSIRSFHHSSYPVARIAAALAERRLGVSVCLPARECAETVGEIVTVLGELRTAGVIDEIVVVDAGSADGTAEVAGRAGAAVRQEAELMPSYGPVLGKGDAMWRALAGLQGDLVCFLDADTQGFSQHFLTGLLGPLVCEADVSMVKAFYRRPIASGGSPDGNGRQPHVSGGSSDVNGGRTHASGGSSDVNGGGTHASGGSSDVNRGRTHASGGGRNVNRGGPEVNVGGVDADGGGRVNHLMARPALELFYPELASVRQPLAGEVAARRELLARLPFATGYGVEIAMLIDAWREVGLDGIVQVDLEEHRNRHQPLSALTPMAFTVLATIARRLSREGRLSDADAGPVERPPLASLRVA